MSETEDQGPAPQDIVSALERTGFMLEQRAALKLEAAGFTVTINDAFPDPNEMKSREIDVVGNIMHEAWGDFIGVEGKVLVECKNYSNPVVMIGRRKSTRELPSVDTCFTDFDPLDLMVSESEHMSLLELLDLACGAKDGQTEIFTGNQLVHMNRKKGGWSAENSAIHDSVQYPLLKVREHELELIRRDDAVPPWKYPSIFYFFPVLLVSGTVYTVAVSETEEPHISEAKWSMLRRPFYLNRAWTTLSTDVVSFEYFPEYIEKRIGGTLSRACSILEKNWRFYDPEWYAESSPSPKDEQMFAKWLAHRRSLRSLPSEI
jgi:hypothetical protein